MGIKPTSEAWEVLNFPIPFSSQGDARRLDGQRFPLSRGPRPRKSGSPSAIAGSARATTSPSRSRFREAMADVPQKPSRGHCCNGFLHRPNAHVWCSVLLFRHRPRPAEDPAFQCDAKSQCTLGCTAIARSMGLPTAAPILATRPRRQVWRRGVFGCEGHGKRANSHGLSQSVAERRCGALGGSCRRDLLDHVIILNERHLKRLMSSYLLYYHDDRTTSWTG